MKVRAIRTGYFNHIRRRGDDTLGDGRGDVFAIPDKPRRKVRKAEEIEYDDIVDADSGAVRKIAKRRFRADPPDVVALADKDGTVPVAYSALWMVPVAQRTPEQTTSSQQVLSHKSDEIKAEKALAKQAATGEAEVI